VLGKKKKGGKNGHAKNNMFSCLAKKKRRERGGSRLNCGPPRLKVREKNEKETEPRTGRATEIHWNIRRGENRRRNILRPLEK